MTEFDDIYKTYFTDVYLYIYKLSGNKNIAEDITSEAFFKALRTIDSFRGDCEVRVWLCQIAKNCYYSYLKKQKRFVDISNLEEVELPEHVGSIEDRIINQSEASHVLSIVHSLPEPYKEVFTLRVFGELSFKQIGALFGKTHNWACVTYHRARLKINEQMEDKNNE